MSRCECRCGYRCGGPGRCTLPILECLAQKEGHFVRECSHDWTGPIKTMEYGASASCVKCGDLEMFHDMRTGP